MGTTNVTNDLTKAGLTKSNRFVSSAALTGVTTSTGTTSTLIDSGANFVASGAVVGLSVYIVASGTSWTVRITAVAATTLTFTPALSAPVASGSAYTIYPGQVFVDGQISVDLTNTQNLPFLAYKFGGSRVFAIEDEGGLSINEGCSNNCELIYWRNQSNNPKEAKMIAGHGGDRDLAQVYWHDGYTIFVSNDGVSNPATGASVFIICGGLTALGAPTGGRLTIFSDATYMRIATDYPVYWETDSLYLAPNDINANNVTIGLLAAETIPTFQINAGAKLTIRTPSVELTPISGTAVTLGPASGKTLAITATQFVGSGAGLTGVSATHGTHTGDVTSSGLATTIASNVITNAMINSAAVIADTKLAQISTTGKVTNAATTATTAATADAIICRTAAGLYPAGDGSLITGITATHGTHTGDVTSSGLATTIASNVITNAMINSSAAIATSKTDGVSTATASKLAARDGSAGCAFAIVTATEVLGTSNALTIHANTVTKTPTSGTTVDEVVAAGNTLQLTTDTTLNKISTSLAGASSPKTPYVKKLLFQRQSNTTTNQTVAITLPAKGNYVFRAMVLGQGPTADSTKCHAQDWLIAWNWSDATSENTNNGVGDSNAGQHAPMEITGGAAFTGGTPTWSISGAVVTLTLVHQSFIVDWLVEVEMYYTV